jgi:pyruvate dehydrogenase E2 component (dihydrolipoamide acetyltransferase)
MEIPAPATGIVKDIKVKLGDRLKEGDELLVLEVDTAAAPAAAETAAPVAAAAQPEVPAETPVPAASAGAVQTSIREVQVPDIGSSDKARVIELLIKTGDRVEEEQSLLTLESDKASMEIPSPVSGVVVEVLARLDSEVAEGDMICRIEVSDTVAAAQPAAASQAAPVVPAAPVAAPAPQQEVSGGSVSVAPASKPLVCQPGDAGACVHAGPAVRKLARELGVDLGQVKPSGPHQRIVKEDVQAYVQQRLSQPEAESRGGMGIEPIPEVDFSRFGAVENVPMTRLQQIGASNLHRAWLNIPHVTQFESADITELEAFRVTQKAVAEKAGTKLTVLPFLLKACAHLLKELPEFNSSLAANGKELILKKYVNIGFAVDTLDGLLVPVIRDVDQKSLLQLAQEAAELADKARNKKLSPDQMQGGCFTISSLGHIGGTGFTPIVNAPEVAILGVSRATMQPVWDGSEFAPRLMLPLSLSYDHRVINGAAAARFTRRLADVLAEIRSLLL